MSCRVDSLLRLGLPFSTVTVAAVVAFPQLISTSKTIRVRGAPGWPFSAVDVAGVGVVASPVLAESSPPPSNISPTN